MRNITNTNNDFVISYLLLRQLIGILGISLPFVVILGNTLLGQCPEIQPSISHYYYSVMHIVFVGTLCVLGGFLVSYRGKSNFENRISNFAGLFAFGVAIFPTDFLGYSESDICHFIKIEKVVPPFVSWIHFGCAGLLFACFVIFCLNIFQESDENKTPDLKKLRRNYIYKICGIGIALSILSIVTITILKSFEVKSDFFKHSTFVFETTSLLFFGSSWLLKGSLNWPESKFKIIRILIKPFRNVENG